MDPRLMEDPAFARAAELLKRLPPELVQETAAKAAEVLPPTKPSVDERLLNEVIVIRTLLQELLRRIPPPPVPVAPESAAP